MKEFNFKSIAQLLTENNVAFPLHALTNIVDKEEGTFALYYTGMRQEKNIVPHEFEWLLFIGDNESWTELNILDTTSPKYGFISYDYKNRVEDLNSNNNEFIAWEDCKFHSPKHVLAQKNEHIYFHSTHEDVLKSLLEKAIDSQENITPHSKLEFKSNISKEQYIECFEKIKTHLQLGDIYELNYCHDFRAISKNFQPIKAFFDLIKKSPAPFSCLFKSRKKYLISASPERFFCKRDKKLYSQPIKGTLKRKTDEKLDLEQREILRQSAKNRSENVMIVDLVRNDLSRIAIKNSVDVEELFGIYTYPFVHQMISTISAIPKEHFQFKQIIDALFPMGSMTGAPKVSAMQIIEKLENFKRGIFSGSTGFILNNSYMDFNVVIRSIIFDSESGNLQLPVGGAITIESEAIDEYEETILKANSVAKAIFGKDIISAK